MATRPHIFEDGESIYLVAPVSPVEVGVDRMEHLAYSSKIDELKRKAPNDSLLWLQGNYVEADNPNANGHEWTASELSIKSLTPMFCPVTVMHDPSTSVGLIADIALKTPERDQVPRARIEDVMAIWAHRYPDVAAETLHNYEEGTLMQSMECRSPSFSCGVCGQTFFKASREVEEKNLCEHLSESLNARRILNDVTFTGTGLIFGSRGAVGAYSEAHLEVAVKEEIVAAHQEFHQRAASTKRKRSVIPMDKMEIDRAEYDELKGRPTRDEFKAVADERDTLRDEKAAAEHKVEETETAQKKAEGERDDLKAEKEKIEEETRASALGGERIEALGKDFRAALGENTTKRVEEQAKTLSDDDWEARLVELEELTGKKRDEGGEGNPASSGAPADTVTTEETASAHLGNGNASPSTVNRSAVIGGLTGKVGKSRKAAA